MALGFFTGDNTPDSYDARERKRRIADALLAQSMSQRPIGSWTEGAAKLAQALAGTYKNSKIDAQDRESSSVYDSKLTQALFGGSPSPAPSTSVNSAPGPMADAGESKPASFGGSQAKFVEALMPHAMKVSQETGIDPRVVIAQSALETGWGKSAPGNNFFGIKSHGREGGQNLATTEVVNGQPVQTRDSFRSYADPGESAADYAAFLKSNPRYQPMLQAQGMDAQIAALAKSGYATDPMYGNKVSQIARGIQVPQGGVGPAPMPGGSDFPPGPVASDAPPMAYAGAPAGQAISGASPQPQPRPPGQQLAQAVAPTSPPIPQPQPTGNVNAAMYQIMSDPRFSPQQKAQALQMFQMQQKDDGVKFVDAGDRLIPTNARGQQVGQPIEKRRAPDKGTNDAENFRLAQNDPNFAKWYQENKRLSAPKTEGAIPPGFRVVRDANGNIERLEPIPGSKEASAADARAKGTQANAKNVVDVIDDIEKEMKGAILPTTGVVGSRLSTMAGTAANNIRTNLDTIRANTSFEKLNEMRQQSPTGGALGSVTVRELELLSATIRNLEQSQTQDQFARNLQRVKQQYQEIIHGPGKPGAPAGETEKPARRKFNPATGRIE